MHAMFRRHPLPLALAVAEKALLEFSNQWLAGLQPQLSLETSKDGQIWVTSRVAAGDVPTQASAAHHRHHAEEATEGVGEALRHPHPRRRGPSYQRRLLRRAAARTAAAKADKAVQTEPEEPADEAVQSATPCRQVAAEVLPAPVQPHHLNFWSRLRDELCPDTDYSTAVQDVLPHHPPHAPHQGRPHIPQVDGNSTLSLHQDQDSDQQERVWSCKCCRYEQFFDTEQDLHQHHDSPGHMLMYEECNICYPWHVWT